MTCNNYNNQSKCGCEFNVKTVGICDVSKIKLNGNQRETLNWTEVSIPEMLCIPDLKPNIEHIDQVYANLILNNTRLIETPFAYRSYMLNSFVIAVQDALTTITPILNPEDGTGTLPTAIDGLITGGLDALTTAVNTAITAIDLIGVFPTVSAVLTNAITTVDTLTDNLNNLLADLLSAISGLLTALTSLTASAICEAVELVNSTLTLLTTLVESVVDVLNGILTSITDAVDALDPADQTLIDVPITTLTTAIQALIDTTVPPLVTAVTDLLADIVEALLPINCDESQAFTLIGNAEGTCLSGRKLIVEGTIRQKVVYTAEVAEQSVHSAHYEVPFLAYIIPYANFEDTTYQENVEVVTELGDDPLDSTGNVVQTLDRAFVAGSDMSNIAPNLCEEFVVDTCIEDVFIYALDSRTMFKNITLFLRARLATSC